jgi:hypothetical protein
MLSVVVDDQARAELTTDLDELFRQGARRMLQVALEAEVEAYIAAHAELVDERGHRLDDWFRLGGWFLVVVGDQGALVGRVVSQFTRSRRPGRASVGRPGPDPGQGAAAVAFQPKLVFEGVEGALDPLGPAAQRAVPVRFVLAVRAQQPGAIAGDQLFELAAGDSLVGQDDQPGRSRCRSWSSNAATTSRSRAWGGQAPGHREPVAGGQHIQANAQKKRWWRLP